MLRAILIVGLSTLAAPALASASPPAPARAPTAAAARRAALSRKALRHALSRDLGKIGGRQGAYVVDLTAHRQLFAVNPNTGRLPASVQKLYTTSTALLGLGPTAVLTTSVLGTGQLTPSGTWKGNLFLRGGGDPTFGSRSFDRGAYGSGVGTTAGQLARALRNAGVRGLAGHIRGDESRFDALRGTPATGYAASFYLEGQLSALAYDRGFANASWTRFQANPPKYAAAHFAAALKAAHVSLPAKLHIGAGKTPARARLLAAVHSPPISTLIQLTNTPSDNFLAEMLLKDLGASFGGAGTTAAGVAGMRRELKSHFHIKPRFDDGSGLSRRDSTSPLQVVTLLKRMGANADFTSSLAVAGETGTLKYEMRGTRAQRNCRGKTGTLYDVASLAGYCTARDGHTLAFAFLLNRLTDSNYGHDVEAKMAVALASYAG
jgi:D-alanyl-D-alanine carboxypeptidase/D-alanyl-D-alanine-endopeptidase (penicillin-binding protein 4)